MYLIKKESSPGCDTCNEIITRVINIPLIYRSMENLQQPFDTPSRGSEY